MKYQIKSYTVEQTVIILSNETYYHSLCRVDINHRLFKIVYLEPKESIEIYYDKELPIEKISILELGKDDKW